MAACADPITASSHSLSFCVDWLLLIVGTMMLKQKDVRAGWSAAVFASAAFSPRLMPAAFLMNEAAAGKPALTAD